VNSLPGSPNPEALEHAHAPAPERSVIVAAREQ
jgi:hypothetical protein